jgi:hypothetical protein
MDAFVEWLRATPLSQAIVYKIWIWPLCETLHFIGLALVIGIAGFFDVRLMGFFEQVSIDDARQLMPLAVIGFLLNLTTGVIFLIGHPEQYAHNPAWWWKFGFLGLAGLNALIFQFAVGRQTVGLRAGADTSPAVKAIGVVSLISWFAVLYFGRMLPFLGGAF